MYPPCGFSFGAVSLGAAFHSLPEHDPAQEALTPLLLPLRISGSVVFLPRLGGERRMDDDLHRILVVSASFVLLRCPAPRRCSRRPAGALGVGGELLGEDARERLRLVVGLGRARPGVADGAVERT